MRRRLCILLALCLLLPTALAALPISAATPDGEAIRSAEDFYSMKSGGSYYLDCDVVLTKPYGQVFSGVLDGNGHTLTTVAIASAFTKLNGATVRDLNISYAYSSSVSATLGALAEVGYGSFEDISAEVKIEINESAERFSHAVGGLIGELNGASVFTDCSVDGYLKVSTSPSSGTGISSALGGIVGRATDAGEVSFISCINRAEIGSKQIQMSVGGIIGYMQKSSQVGLESCVNEGSVSGVSGTHSGVGGICGTADGTHAPDASVRFVGCQNRGIVEESGRVGSGGNLHVGGLLGRGYGIALAEFENCINTGSVISGGGGWASAGGIAGGVMTYGFAWSGTHDGVLRAYNCANIGEVRGGAFCGGIIGGALQYNTNGSQVDIERCASYGSVAGDSAGGIIGHCGESGFNGLLIKDCYNGGRVDGKSVCGGIVATVNVASDSSDYAVTQVRPMKIEGCINAGNTAAARVESAGIVSAVPLGSLELRGCVNIEVGGDDFAAISHASSERIRPIGNLYVGKSGEHSFGTAIDAASANGKAEALLLALPADTGELTRWLEAIDGYEAGGYAEGWTALTVAVIKARECVLVASPYDEVRNAEKALLTALEGLVLKDSVDNSELISALELAEQRLGMSEEYTKDSWAHFILEYERVKYKKYSSNEEDIKSSAEALLSALSFLGNRADFEELRAELNKYADYRQEEFAPEGWASFREAFRAASELNDPTNVSVQQVEEALIRLRNAAAELEPIADADLLIAELERMLERYESELYTASSYAEFERLLLKWIGMLEEQSYSEEFIESVREDADGLTAELVERGDLSRLDGLLEEAFFCKESDYSARTWRELLEVLEEIEAARAPEIACELGEDDVAALGEKLRVAIDARNEEQTSEPTSEEEKGCEGSISGAVIVIAALACPALLLKKRKEN